MTIDKYMDEIIDFGYNVQGYKENKMTFCKYEFLSETEWATYKAQITTKHDNIISFFYYL